MDIMSQVLYCFAYFRSMSRRVEVSPVIVPNSIPVLYYGSYSNYRRSNLKVITVGSNPPSEDFPRLAPGLRFRDAPVIHSSLIDVLQTPAFSYPRRSPQDMVPLVPSFSTASGHFIPPVPMTPSNVSLTDALQRQTGVDDFLLSPQGIATFPLAELVQPYLDALDTYFSDGKPYHPMFAHYEAILQGMGASYYQPMAENSSNPSRQQSSSEQFSPSGQSLNFGASNTALHTNFWTPIATTLQWRSIHDDTKKLLRRGIIQGEPHREPHAEEVRYGGLHLWSQLVSHLQPDVVFVAMPQPALKKMDAVLQHVCQAEGSQVVGKYLVPNRYSLTAKVIQGQHHSLLFVHRDAIDKTEREDFPFALVSDAHLAHTVGEWIRELTGNIRHSPLRA